MRITRKKLVAGIIAITVLASLGIAFVCSRVVPLLGTNYDTTDVSAEQLAKCEELMSVTFPASSTAVGLWSKSWQDSIVRLKVRMRRADLPQFLADSPFADVEMRSDRRHVGESHGPRWWTPDAPVQFESATTGLGPPDKEQDGLDILINLDDPDTVVLYLVWFDM